MVWKFCGKAQFLHCFGLQNFQTRKLGEITVFFTVKRIGKRYVSFAVTDVSGGSAKIIVCILH